MDQIGPVSFQIRLADGRIRKRHVDHVRIRYPEEHVVPSEPIAIEGPSVPSSNGNTQQSGEIVSGNGSTPQRHDSVPPSPPIRKDPKAS